MDSFFVTLPSNVVSEEYAKSNRIGNYRTKLARRLELDNSWEVALYEVSYTYSWYNIMEPIRILYLVFDTASLSKPYFEDEPAGDNILQAGSYTARRFTEEFNRILGNLKKSGDKSMRCEIDPATNLVRFIPLLDGNMIYYPVVKGSFGLDLGMFELYYEMRLMLGGGTWVSLGKNPKRSEAATERYIELTRKWTAHFRSKLPLISKNPLDFNGGYHSLFIYSDIIQSCAVGDTFTKLLRVVEVPSSYSFGDQCVVTYDNPQYHPLLKKDIDSIEIDIKDDSGETVPFRFGRSICTLHFRKRQ